jgi:hypothetical protein
MNYVEHTKVLTTKRKGFLSLTCLFSQTFDGYKLSLLKKNIFDSQLRLTLKHLVKYQNT